MFSYLLSAISIRTIYSIITAFVLCIILEPIMIRKMMLRSIGQQVRKNGPKTHLTKDGNPTMGGLVVLLSIFITAMFWARTNRLVAVTLVTGLGMGIIGFFDDVLKIARKNSKGLKIRDKLIWQFVIALGVALYLYFNEWVPGMETYINFPGLKQINLGWMYVPFTMLVLIGCSNAVNLTDGLDGLAAGIVSIVALCYAGIAYVVGNTIFSSHLKVIYIAGAGELTILCAAIFGAGLGFLWFNSFPAQIFMGDVGSLSLGALLGGVAVLTKNELLLLVIGGIFVIEALSVIIQIFSFRVLGKRTFRMSPLHHHFELKGWPEPKVVFRFWIITYMLALIGLSLFGLNSILYRTEPEILNWQSSNVRMVVALKPPGTPGSA